MNPMQLGAGRIDSRFGMRIYDSPSNNRQENEDAGCKRIGEEGEKKSGSQTGNIPGVMRCVSASLAFRPCNPG